MLDAASAEQMRKVPFRGGGFVVRRRRGMGWVVLAIVLAIWQAASSLGFVNPIFLPSPLDIGRALTALALSGQLFVHLAASLKRLAAGFAIGASAGIAMGFCFGLVSLARACGMPVVAALFPIPKIALLPLFILWFGIGEPSKIATIAFGSFFPMTIATMSGVDAADRTLIRMAQSFNVSMRDIVLRVIWPAALPAILAGLRIASSIAIVLIVAAEMIGANEGLGAFVLTAGNLMQSDQLLAGVVVLSVLGLCIAELIGFAERRLLGWR
ncbi:MAG TPA: ABC transporter permease [Beijerinckiaceae bacterium]|nr:ABC transporter permease [Beijerinckiaceae bacterium]